MRHPSESPAVWVEQDGNADGVLDAESDSVATEGVAVPLDSSPVFTSLAAELLRSGRSVSFRATGGSMRPTIRDGEKITVSALLKDPPRRGDIVLYAMGDRLVAHRVIEIPRRKRSARKGGAPGLVPSHEEGADFERSSPFMVSTRGDAVLECDAPIDLSRVLGRVISVERRGRRLDFRSPEARLRFLWGRSAAFLRHMLRPVRPSR